MTYGRPLENWDKNWKCHLIYGRPPLDRPSPAKKSQLLLGANESGLATDWKVTSIGSASVMSQERVARCQKLAGSRSGTANIVGRKSGPRAWCFDSFGMTIEKLFKNVLILSYKKLNQSMYCSLGGLIATKLSTSFRDYAKNAQIITKRKGREQNQVLMNICVGAPEQKGEGWPN